MTQTVGVVVGTFGDQSWVDLARSRALPSVYRQTRPADEVIHMHCDTLHEARNTAVSQLATEWVVTLDADDELDPHYIEAMAAAVSGGPALYQPATLGIVGGRPDSEPVLIPPKASLFDGNWMVIGTMVERDQFLRVGGFRDLPAWEDWDLFIRCWRAGATFVQVPDAVYRVHVSPSSRNDLSPERARQLFKQIRDRYGEKERQA